VNYCPYKTFFDISNLAKLDKFATVVYPRFAGLADLVHPKTKPALVLTKWAKSPSYTPN